MEGHRPTLPQPYPAISLAALFPIEPIVRPPALSGFAVWNDVEQRPARFRGFAHIIFLPLDARRGFTQLTEKLTSGAFSGFLRRKERQAIVIEPSARRIA